MSTGKAYDAIGYQFFCPSGATLVIDGTNSALAFEAGSEVTVPFSCKLTHASRYVTTGATAAVALSSAVIAKSAAGTGSLTAIGTFTYTGTQATGAVGTASISTGTAANLNAGDVVGISEALQTVAVINTMSFWLGFTEIFE